MTEVLSLLLITTGLGFYAAGSIGLLRLPDLYTRLHALTKADNLVEMSLLENCIREDLDRSAPRRMAVLHPLKIVIENYPEGRNEQLPAANHPKDEAMGSRRVALALAKTGFDDPDVEADTLSGGWRTRLAIARAVLADPKILILDEATSNLDTESELTIQSSLATLMDSRTAVVIAHRLSTVRNADMILVLDKGRLVEADRHEELVGARGIYSRLVAAQV